MAKLNPYRYTDPQGYGALVEEQAQIDRIGRTQQAVMSVLRTGMQEASITDDEANQFGFTEAERLHPDEAPEEKQRRAADYSRRVKELYTEAGESKKRAIFESINDGSLANHLNAALQKDQIAALEQGNPYRRTEQQAWYEYMMSLEDDDKLRLFQHYGADGDPQRLAEMSSEDVQFLSSAYESIAALMDEDMHSAPSKEFPWWSTAIDWASRPFTAIVGVPTGMYAAAREIAPADYAEKRSSDHARRVLTRVMERVKGEKQEWEDVPWLMRANVNALGAPVDFLESGEIIGLDLDELLGKVWDKPALLARMVVRGLEYGFRNATEGIQDNPTRMPAHHWQKSMDELRDNALLKADDDLARGDPDVKTDADVIARAEQYEKQALQSHVGSFFLEHPHISEFLSTLFVPTGLGLAVQGVGASAKLFGAATTSAAKAVAKTGVAQGTALRVGNFAKNHPNLVQQMGRVAEGAKTAKDGTRDWWYRTMVYQGWVKKLGDSEAVQELRRLVIAADQMAAGEMDATAGFRNRLIKKLDVESADDAAWLHYALDEPWSMVSVGDDLDDAYKRLIPHVLSRRGQPGSTRQIIDRTIERLDRSADISDTTKKVGKALTDEQRDRMAAVIDEPYSAVAVPEHLREAFDAGVALKEIDQGLKETAGTMNRWSKVKQRSTATKKAQLERDFDVDRIGLGYSKSKVRKVIRNEAKRTQPRMTESEALKLGDKHVLTRGRFRDHWVPRAHWAKEGEVVDPAILAPIHRNMRHPSALQRKLSLDEAVQNGLVLNPSKQFEKHFQSAKRQYTAGAQLRAVDAVMRGERFAVSFDLRDVNQAMDAAVDYTRKANRHIEEYKAAQLVIRNMEGRLSEIAGRMRASDPSTYSAVAKHHTVLKGRKRRLLGVYQRNINAIDKARAQQKRLLDLRHSTTDPAAQRQITDEIRSIRTQIRTLKKDNVRRMEKLQKLEESPAELARRKTAKPQTEREKFAAAMPREDARKWLKEHQPRKLAETHQIYADRITAKRIEAQQLLARAEAYRIAGDAAGAESAMRITTTRQFASTKARLQKETGLEWREMREIVPESMYREYLRVVGTPGKTFDSTVTLVPKEYAAFLQDLMPWIGGARSPVDEAAHAYEQFMRHAVRPIQKTWRTLVTVPRLLYTAKNFTSSVGLGSAALAGRSLNPELQAAAMAASALSASDTGRAMEMAKGYLVYLKNETRTLDEIIAVARKLGLTSQLEARIGSDVVTEGNFMQLLPQAAEAITELAPLQVAARAVGGETAGQVVAHLSPAYWARATENYQHLITFIGALDDLTPRGVAKAFEFQNKWSGNYRLLGPAEKTILKDAFGFYGWARFIVPHIGRLVKDRPEMLMNFIKMRGGWERYAGKYTPVDYEYTPRFIRGLALGAPQEVQPHTHKLDPDVAYYAAAAMETPEALSLAYAPFIEALVDVAGGDIGAARRAPFELLGPAMRVAWEMITLEDEQGRRLPPMWDPESATTMKDSLLMRTFLSGPGTMAAPWVNLYRLYSGRPEDKPYRLMLTVGRQMLGLDNHVARLLGAEPRSIGGMTDPATGGFPGVQYHMVEHRREIANSLSRSLGGARDYIQRQQHIIEGGID